jgi:uncharacterized protein (TIRG00374 family)
VVNNVTDMPTETQVATVNHRRRRLLLRTVVVVAAVVFVVANRAELPVAWRSLRRADLGWLLVALAVSLMLVVNQGAIRWRGQRLLGIHRSLPRAVRLSVGGHFLNMITKSGGMAGVAPFNTDARANGMSVHRSTAGYLLAELANHLGFTVALIVAVPVISNDDKLSAVDVVAMVIFGLLTLAFVAGVVAAGRSQESIRRLHELPNRVRNVVLRRLKRPLHPPITDHHAADDLHEAVTMARSDPTAMVPLALQSMAQQVIGIALLWVVLRSMGLTHGLNVVLVSYVIATLFSIVGFLPAGLGFVEVSMAATLVSYGLSTGQATAAVGVYRLFQLWMPLALGAAVLRSRQPATAQVSRDT